MSKVIRKFRQMKKKNRTMRVAEAPAYPKHNGFAKATVVDIEHTRGKVAPFAIMEMNDTKFHVVATEGMRIGDKMVFGDESVIRIGSCMQIKNIPEGNAIHSVEYEFNDGGKVAMTAGAYCTIENHRRETDQTVLKLPSGQKKVFPSNVRAIVGVVAGAGVTEKPLLKAGTAHYLKKSRGQLFPRVRGVAMNPVDHKHGGGNHQHIGTSSCRAKTAPYAQQVGLVGARSTGRGRGAKK